VSGYLVDTDVLIDVWRGHPPALAWFGSLTVLPAVPGFVVMELIQDARDRRQLQQALKLVQPFAVVWPTEADCARALSDFAAHRLSSGLGLLDALIGACAAGRGDTLYTFNSRHYRVLQGLQVKAPYTR
jgi:predicted nucleic acid-binding protein